MKFIGIDLGTTSTCGVCLDLKTGQVRSESRENRAWLATPRSWERLQNPTKLVGQATRILESLLGRNGKAAGIGVTGQMHGMVYLDREGQAVGPLHTWQDGRGGLACEGQATWAEVLTRRTGYAVAPGYGLVTHFYNLKKGLVPRGAAGFCTIQDYLALRLTGKRTPLVDASDAASLGVFDLARQCFDTAALKRAGVPTALLPELAPSATRLGAWRGIPVYTALGDNQASFLGSVREREQTALVNVGTGSQVSAWIPRYATALGLETRPFPGGGYLLVGAALCGGKSYALLERFFRESAETFGLRTRGVDFFRVMNRVDPAQLEGRLAVDTRFSGTRLNPSLRGAITGISLTNFTPAHLVCGFLQGMAGELHGHYAAMPVACKRRIKILAGSGNAVRHNPLLVKILEARFGLRLRVPAHREEASLGAALTAAVGAGAVESFAEAGKQLRYERTSGPSHVAGNA